MHAVSRSIATPATAAPVATAAAAVDDTTPAPNVRGELRRLFTHAIQAAFPEASAEVALVPCANPKFGDYQCEQPPPASPACALLLQASFSSECMQYVHECLLSMKTLPTGGAVWFISPRSVVGPNYTPLRHCGSKGGTHSRENASISGHAGARRCGKMQVTMLWQYSAR